MFSSLLSVVLSFSVTFFMMPVIIFMAKHLELYDVPSERKVHRQPVPSLGGLGLFAGLAVTVLSLLSFADAPEFQYFLAALIVLFFTGLKDDLLAMAPFKKIAAQLLASFFIIRGGGLRVENMFGFLGVYELMHIQSTLLTYFVLIVVINAINLIDGVDGLAGSLGITAAALFGCYFLMVGLLPYALFSFALGGSLAAFLIFNVQPAKIFMGDTGSLLTGAVCAILVVKFINVSASNALVPVAASPAVGFSILMIPLSDTLRVFSIRILNRRSPLHPDKKHIHHLLLHRGWSHRKITLVLTGVNLLFVFLAYTGRSLGSTWVFTGLLAFFFLGVGCLTYAFPKYKRPLGSTASAEPALPPKPVVQVIALPGSLHTEDLELKTEVSKPVYK